MIVNQHVIDNRAVAFLDILGFSKMIQKFDIATLGEKYEKLMNQVDAMRIPNPLGHEKTVFSFLENKDELLCKQFIFSDSIILIANDDSEESFFKLILHAWRVLQIFISFGMPLRGAISYGDIFINEKINMFLGKSLTNAYELERQQQWIGVIIDQIAADKYDIFNNEIMKELCIEYEVPFKSGINKKYRTLNWRLNMIVKNGTRSLFSVDEDSDDETIIKKINNTLDYARFIVSRQKVYLYGEDVPVEFGNLYVGDTEPPFKHGDEL